MATVTRRRCHETGQALAEYGILLALVSVAGWVHRVTTDVLAEPRTLLIGGAVVAAAIVFFASSSGRR